MRKKIILTYSGSLLFSRMVGYGQVGAALDSLWDHDDRYHFDDDDGAHYHHPHDHHHQDYHHDDWSWWLPLQADSPAYRVSSFQPEPLPGKWTVIIIVIFGFVEDIFFIDIVILPIIVLPGTWSLTLCLERDQVTFSFFSKVDGRPCYDWKIPNCVQVKKSCFRKWKFGENLSFQLCGYLRLCRRTDADCCSVPGDAPRYNKKLTDRFVCWAGAWHCWQRAIFC